MYNGVANFPQNTFRDPLKRCLIIFLVTLEIVHLLVCFCSAQSEFLKPLCSIPW